jgi:selenocysteine lyase/cysteine desulfurase
MPCAHYREVDVDAFEAPTPWWARPLSQWAEDESRAPLPSWPSATESAHPDFLLRRGTRYLNHGSYGACLQVCAREQDRIRRSLEANPVAFMEDAALPALVHAMHSVARFVGAEASDIAFVPNATTGVAAALRAVAGTLQRGDVVVAMELVYGSVLSALRQLCIERGARLVLVSVRFPFRDDEFIVSRRRRRRRVPADLLLPRNHWRPRCWPTRAHA